MARGFNIVNHIPAGMARQNIFHQQHQQAVRPDDLAMVVDQRDPITITVKGQAQIGFVGQYGLLQALQIVRYARVRVMVGKLPSTSQNRQVALTPSRCVIVRPAGPAIPLPASTTMFSGRAS